MKWLAIAVAILAGVMIGRAYQTAIAVKYIVSAATCNEQLKVLISDVDNFLEVIRD